VTPASLSEPPIAEDADAEGEMAEGAASEGPAPLLNRFIQPEFVRPTGRSSPSHARPTVTPESGSPRATTFMPRQVFASSAEPMATRYGEQSPLYDPMADQLRLDVEQLRRENAQFQQLMEEMRKLLQEAAEQEQRMQAELADRETQLAASVAKLDELQAIVDAKPKTKSELEEWADELERESFQVAQERRTLEQERQQLRDDEAALEKQMRDMEVQMARERAMLARQEQELKRLNAEIQHELEVMQRGDGTLRERLAVFQRRHAEVVAGPPPNGAAYAGYAQSPVAPSATPTPPPKKNDTTGLLRKIFRGGE
jgi:hypothetical protein